MAKLSLRFGVRDVCGNRASTWKLFAQTGVGKQDVYLTCRSLRGALKASMHDSGDWHIRFYRRYLKDNLEEDHPKHEDPYLDRWPRPAEFAPGMTLAYRIVVPTAGLNIAIKEPAPSSIIWIPAAPENKAVEIDIILAAPDVTCSHWPGRNSMETQLVGRLTLDSGDTVWAVHRVVEIPQLDVSGGKATWFNGKSLEDLRHESAESVRVIVFGDSEDGSRVAIDTVIVVNKKRPC